MPVIIQIGGDRNHILRQIGGKRSAAGQSSAPGQAGPGGDVQRVIRGDRIAPVKGHIAADSARAVLKHDGVGFADGRRCGCVPAVADGSATSVFCSVTITGGIVDASSPTEVAWEGYAALPSATAGTQPQRRPSTKPPA